MDSYSYSTYSGADPLLIKLRTYLRPDENLLWSGKPQSGVTLDAGRVFGVFFALFWLGFSIFWTLAASGILFGEAGETGLFGLFGVPFICVGIFLLYTSLFGGRSQAKNTMYGVTDSRVLMMTDGRRGTRFTEIPLEDICGVQMIGEKDGKGTLILQHVSLFAPYGGYPYAGYNSSSARSTTVDLHGGFYHIAGVESVQRLLSDEIDSARRRADSKEDK